MGRDHQIKKYQKQKMKLSVAIVSTVAASAIVKRSNQGEKALGDVEKRYSQLVDMMGHYNNDFDERKYWAYGCNCLILGDRPMSDPGYGPPVDPLDAVCKAYKDCVKCAKMTHGDMCIGEFVKYKYGYKNGDAVCKDKAGTCGRSLCECDAMFARQHAPVTGHFKNEFHMFWSTTAGYPMWDPKNDDSQCPRGGGGVYEPECCGGYTTPFVLFNTVNKKCCPGGKVVFDNQRCPGGKPDGQGKPAGQGGKPGQGGNKGGY